jgi:tetratricopeptide (TPR) repeat protein
MPWLMIARIHTLQENNEQAEAAFLKAVEMEPENPAGYRALAQFYSASGQQAQALERLEALAANKPNDTTALMQVAQIHHEGKDAAKAAEAYERILKIDPANFPALNNLAFLCAEDLNDLNRGYELARKAHDLRPQDPTAADTLGWILVKRGEIPAGLGLLQESSSKAPGDAEKAYHLGVAHYLLGEEGPARASLERAVGQPGDFAGRLDAERRLQVLTVAGDEAAPEVVENLARYVADQPSDTIAIFRLAAVRERSGQPAEAKALYEQALKHQPKNVNAMLRLALVEAKGLNNRGRAIELMNQAVQLAPGDARVAQASSKVAYAAGDYRRALSLAQEAARGLPRNPEAQYDLALANYGVGNLAEALTDARNSLAMGSDFERATEARTFLSMLEIQQSPATAADGPSKVQEVLKARPNDVAAQMAAGALHESKGDHDSAKTAYERILTQNPIFVPAMRRLGYVLAHSNGDQAAALRRAQELASRLPGDPELGKVVGILQFRAGDAAAAMRTLAPIATQRQNDGELLFYLGMSQAQAGDKAPAQASLTRALTLNLPSEQADAARKRLEGLK